MPDHSKSPKTKRLRAGRRGVAPVLAALLVMLLAVIPHLTLAASNVHAAAMGKAAAMPAHSLHDDGGHGGEAKERCHDDADPSGGAMPPCCVIGCGIVALMPEFSTSARESGWSSLHPPPAEAGKDTGIEPAERPPRADRSPG